MRTLALVCLSLILDAPAHAGPAGSVAGAVRTVDGVPVPQIALMLRGPSGPRRVVTGPEGRFRAGGLAPGQYALTVHLPGFLPVEEARVVDADVETRFDVTLAPAPVAEQVVVTGSRGEAALSTVGVATTALSRERIDEREASSLVDLVREVPGLAVARSGGIGLQASLFVRGGDSRYARVLLDGVPLNQPGGSFDFGSALPLELERVEVARGAGSSLYGTDALAGVVQLLTRRADPGDGTRLHAEGEAGNFARRRFQLGTAGREGDFDWNAGLLRFDTDNEEPNSAFRQNAGAAALGARLGSRSELRLLLRAEDSTVGTPGATAFGRPDRDASFERTDLALGLDFRHSRDRLSHLVRIGYASSQQLSLDPEDSGSYVPRWGDRVGSFPVSDFPDPQGYQNDTARLSLGYQGETQLGQRLLLTAGVDVERETGEIGGRAGELLSPERTNAGAYFQSRTVLGHRIFLTGGLRLEHNDSFGTRAVPRGALAVRLREGGAPTTLKASAGSGIKEPTFLESFGVSFYALGNPDLDPERSRTYDLGLEQRWLSDRVRAEATVFHHDYLDQIAYRVVNPATFQGSFSNVGHSRARGVELSVEAAPTPRLSLTAGYTHLETEILTSTTDFDPVYSVGRPLLRRPKDQATFSARWTASRVSLGATWLLVGERPDSDFLGLGLDSNPGYGRLDARARVRLGRGFEAYVIGENVLDESYQDVLGYPALGRSVRAGLRLRLGRS